MKKIFTLFLLLFSASSFAQTDYNVSLKTPADCKAAEPAVLEAANLSLSKPIAYEGTGTIDAFIWTWAQNTEYTVPIAGNITKLMKGKTNGRLLWLFVAAEAKFIIEHPEKSKDKDQILLSAYTTLADYVSNAANGVEINKTVQKLIDAKKNGTLEAYSKEG